ncbi:F0F1 ATP synthase subunit gamma [Acuticoccus sediminis]|uniref:F0F1 ATP synthase subunit gamma n=1 Tax=Acuticoccus sediminis TaxID=2184697 RepID=UPI0013915C3D|nr:FoF1 ATP synthase subunit gamma [Acuticoccus sediminis]
MADRHAEIQARIANVTQLQAVVTAMRGIAAARAQHGRSLLSAIDAYGRLVGGAIGRAAVGATADETPAASAPPRTALVAFCAEEGFAGAFSEHILDAVAAAAPEALIIVGTRGAAIARERGIEPTHTAVMPSHVDALPALATSLVDMVYEMLAEGEVSRLEVVFGRQVSDSAVAAERISVLPLDTARFRPQKRTEPPLTTLPPAVLVERLAAEYVFAALCATAMHAYVAENDARLRAMAAARNNIEQRLTDLSMTEKALRQEEITSEIIELCAGAEAARS